MKFVRGNLLTTYAPTYGRENLKIAAGVLPIKDIFWFMVRKNLKDASEVLPIKDILSFMGRRASAI